MSVYPEVIVEKISSDIDFLIVACDGIWDCLTNQQAVDFVYQQKSKIAKKGLTASPDSISKKKQNASPAGKPSKIGGKSSVTSKTAAAGPVEGAQINCKVLELMMEKICPNDLAQS